MSESGSSGRKPWEHAKSGGSEADPLAAGFVASLDYDTRIFREDIAGSLAHARMLRHVGLLSDDELAKIEKGLTEIRGEIEAAGLAWPGWKVELEDVHMCIEAALIERAGDAGRKLHTGRSRNDQVALDLKLWIESASVELQAAFGALFEAFVDLAQRDGLIVMPSYTHLQRAQPIVVGGELMAWMAALDRAQDRLTALRAVNRHNPLGSGAIAGSSLPLDRQWLSEQLEVGPPTPSSIDGTASRDAALDFVYALSMISMTLSRWAEQWIIYASTEFGFIKLDQKYTTGSSMMPQKQNPDMLELIRGRSGGVYGQLVALLTMCKGITVGYNRDLQEDKRHVFAAYDSVLACMKIASGIVRTTRFNEARIASTLDQGFLDATSLAEYLVSRGMAFRTAHQVVGAVVHWCSANGRVALSSLRVEELNQIVDDLSIDGARFDASVYDWLGAQNVVKRYRSSGNGGVSGFQEQLEAWRKRLRGTGTVS